MKVVLTDQVFPTTDVEEGILSDAGASLSVLSDPSLDSIKKHASDADGLLNTYAPIDADIMDALDRCKVIARYGIGVDNVDLDHAKRKGITITNVPDYCVDEVADHAFALMLALVRKITTGNGLVREGHWGISGLRPIHRLDGRTLGLVGFGHIGKEVAVRGAAFKLRVVAYDPYVPDDALRSSGVERRHELDQLLADADIVSIHAPLVASTRGMIDADALGKMRPGSMLVNTSRGPIVDTQAVLDALTSGHLAGAALDVFAEEPPDHTALADVPGLVATPHSAFYSEESIRESQSKATRCVVAVLKGEEPPYRIV